LGVPVAHSDVLEVAGSAWLDSLALPQPGAEKITSLRQLVGELSAEVAMLTGVIGDVTRFATADRLCWWAGLTPWRRESDVKVSRCRVTKQGSRMLRWVVIEAVSIFPPSHRSARARRDRRPPRHPGQEHRQDRRRPQAAHPDLLRSVRPPDPVPHRGRGGMTATATQRLGATSAIVLPRHPGGAGGELIDAA
jgi:Transposase IS116/IS110/IS902 family